MAESTIGAKVDAWAKGKEKRVHEFMKWAVRRMLRHAKMKANVSRRSTGPRGGKVFVSSSPGDYPGKREGDFVRSIRSDVKIGKGQIEGKIYSTIGHAIHLEAGTSKMEPRPTMHLTLDELLPEIRRTFARMVKK